MTAPAIQRTRIGYAIAACDDPPFGAAASLCLELARRVHVADDNEILTTCASARLPGGRYHEGFGHIGATRVRRFPELADLVEYVRAYQEYYDGFVFFGAGLAASDDVRTSILRKAILVPVLRDESTPLSAVLDDLRARPRAVVFGSEEERDLVNRSLPNHGATTRLIASGPATPPDADERRFRDRFAIDAPFLLCVAEGSNEDGIDALLALYERYRSERSTAPQLVLAGYRREAVPKRPGVIVIAGDDEGARWDAMRACNLLVVPQHDEAPSDILRCAWGYGTPALVNAESRILVEQCRRAGAGLWYGSYDEFAVALDALEEDGLRRALGRQGQDYMQALYDAWDDATREFAALLESVFPLAHR